MSPISASIEGYIVTHRNTPSSQSIGRKILSRFARETGDPAIGDLTRHHIEAWWTAVARTAAPRSKKAYYSTVSCFLRWLGVAGDPLEMISRPTEPRSAPRTLSPQEVDRLRASCRNLRDRSIIELTWGVGLRCIEVSNLQIPDVDLVNMLILIHGKGNHVDELPLPQRVAWALEAYFEVAPPMATGYVIRNLHNGHSQMTPEQISRSVARVAWRSGVKKAAYDGRGAHGLRRTCATELLESGANIRDVQGVLRHESLATTEKYLRRARLENMREALEHRIEATG